MRPTRAEALYELARHHREREQWHLGVLFAEAACAIPYPDHDVLFVHRDVHEFRALEEFAICAFYTARWRDGQKACQRLLSMQLPAADRARIERHLSFYRDKK
jgi:hypothetical protein